MFKPLITLLLAATHLVSWSATPRYLCIDRDGLVCIDAGPNDCDCCREHAHEHEGFFEDGCEHEQAVIAAASAIGSASLAAGNRCDCEHLAIGGSGAPAIVRSTSPVDSVKLSAPTPVHATPVLVVAAAMPGAQADAVGQLSATHFVETVLRTVVLRC